MDNYLYKSFATSFVAPSYVPYVFHILADAKVRGIERLYFVSRDAYILQQIAEQIPHEGIEYRYLFISRASLENAFFYISTEKEKRDLGFQNVFKSDREYKESYDLTMGYLRQERIFDDNIALVDVGWFGMTRAIINRIRGLEGKESLFFYYYGIHQVCLSKEYGDYDSYIKEPIHLEWSTYIIEEYFSRCPYPTTTGYKKDDKGLYTPTFPDGEAYEVTPFVKENVDACLRMTKELLNRQINDDELYSLMEKAHKKLFESSYVSKHKEFYPIFNDHYNSIYKFDLHELVLIIKGGVFDYRVNCRTNTELAVGCLGYKLIIILHRIYRVWAKLKHKLI